MTALCREDLVGAAVQVLQQEHGIPRDQLWLQTKFTPISGRDPASVPYDVDAELETQVQQSIDRSLQNLGTDTIDSLVLRSPVAGKGSPTMKVWRVFEGAVEAGIVGQLGIGNCYDLSFLQKLFAAAKIKPVVLQNRFYAKTGYDKELRKFCLENGMKYQTFWTLGANPQQVMFRWLIQCGHQPLTGTKSREHMEQDLAVTGAEWELSPEEMQSIGLLFE